MWPVVWMLGIRQENLVEERKSSEKKAQRQQCLLLMTTHVKALPSQKKKQTQNCLSFGSTPVWDIGPKRLHQSDPRGLK